MIDERKMYPDMDDYAEYEKQNMIQHQDENPQYVTPIVSSSADPSFLIFSLDADSTIEKIENELRGRVFNPEENKWVQEGKAKFNDKGVNALMFIIRSRLHKIAQLTSIDENACKRITKETVLDVNDALFINWDRWGFTDDDGNIDISQYSSVVHTIDHNVYFAVMRAKDGGERRTIRGMYNYIQRTVEGVKAKSKGFFAGILPTRK